MITPEDVSRISSKWYAAVNKGSLGTMLRAAVLTGNIGGYGSIYDQMRAVEPNHEANIIQRFTRTGQHACRDHREQVAKIVASLFATDDLEMEHVKQSVFGVPGGAPIIGYDHPAIQALFKTQTDVYHLTLRCNVYVIDSQCSHSCLQMKS